MCRRPCGGLDFAFFTVRACVGPASARADERLAQQRTWPEDGKGGGAYPPLRGAPAATVPIADRARTGSLADLDATLFLAGGTEPIPYVATRTLPDADAAAADETTTSAAASESATSTAADEKAASVATEEKAESLPDAASVGVAPAVGRTSAVDTTSLWARLDIAVTGVLAFPSLNGIGVAMGAGIEVRVAALGASHPARGSSPGRLHLSHAHTRSGAQPATADGLRHRLPDTPLVVTVAPPGEGPDGGASGRL